MAVKNATRFDDEILHAKAAVYTAGRGDKHRAGRDGSCKLAEDRYAVGENVAFGAPRLTDGKTGAMHIAKDFSLELDLARGSDASDHNKAGADNR
jgi:hypothetical protein